MTVRWKHDCDKCRFLGQCIGGGHLVDLYVCGDALVARYSDEGSHYYSTLIGYATPTGHAELWAARSLVEKNFAEPS